MANDSLVQAIKTLVALAKGGDMDAAYRGYRDLFAASGFADYRVEDQRQALRLMIMVKGAPATPAMAEAHRAAMAPLRRLAELHREPKDYELLGICHVVIGDEATASAIFKSALAIERERNPQSDLCGALMKRVSML